MLHKDQIENIFKLYINTNTGLMKDKDKILYDFKEKESSLRDYQERLYLLNNQEKEINFEYFVNIKEMILSVLMNFNTDDISSNINNIISADNYITNLKKELIEITKIMDIIKDNWGNFIELNPKFKNSDFNKYYIEKIENSLSEIENMNSNKVSESISVLNKFKDEVIRYINYIKKCNDYLNLYMFIGDEAEAIKNKIQDLVLNQEEGTESNHLFFSKFTEIETEILFIIKDSKPAKGKIEVVNMQNEKHKSINKYTFRFGDYILKYDTFFNNESLKMKSLKKYFYLNNLPLHGIFKGSDIVLNLEVDKDYIKANDIMKSTMNKYLISATLFVFCLYLFGFIINIQYYSIFHLFSSIALFSILPIAFRRKKEELANKFNIKDFFLYEEINILYFKDGARLDIKDLIWGAIREVDNTILNKKFIEENNKNG